MNLSLVNLKTGVSVPTSQFVPTPFHQKNTTALGLIPSTKTPVSVYAVWWGFHTASWEILSAEPLLNKPCIVLLSAHKYLCATAPRDSDVAATTTEKPMHDKNTDRKTQITQTDLQQRHRRAVHCTVLSQSPAALNSQIMLMQQTDYIDHVRENSGLSPVASRHPQTTDMLHLYGSYILYQPLWGDVVHVTCIRGEFLLRGGGGVSCDGLQPAGCRSETNRQPTKRISSLKTWYFPDTICGSRAETGIMTEFLIFEREVFFKVSLTNLRKSFMFESFYI